MRAFILWDDSTKEYVNSGQALRTGNAAIGSAQTSLVVTMSSAMANANYVVTCTMKNITDSNPQFQPLMITAQTTTTFTVKWNANTDTANYSISYIVIG